jgi:hypothetical protein
MLKKQFRLLLLCAGSVVFLGACTQAQQQAISSEDLDQRLTDAVEGAQRSAGSAIHWINTESAIWSLKAKVRNAGDNLSSTQVKSLENSVSYIENLQRKSIESGSGISDSEHALIQAAVKRVENRLDGWLAARDNANIQ